MIHAIEINEATELQPLKKLFRKKLMTGGAVLRLQDGLSEEVHQTLFDRFAPDATDYNVNSLVLVELAKEPGLSLEILSTLASLKLRPVIRALLERKELTSEVKSALRAELHWGAGIDS